MTAGVYSFVVSGTEGVTAGVTAGVSTFVVTQTGGVTAGVTARVTSWWSGHTICLVGWLGPQVWLLKSMFLSFSWGVGQTL